MLGSKDIRKAIQTTQIRQSPLHHPLLLGVLHWHSCRLGSTATALHGPCSNQAFFTTVSP